MKIEILLFCQDCGEELVIEKDPKLMNNYISVDVPLCKTCIKDREEAAWDSGNESGYDSGIESGYEEGSRSRDDDISVLEEKIAELEKELEELKDKS